MPPTRPRSRRCDELTTRRASVADGSGLRAEVEVLATAFGEGARELLRTD